MALRPRGRTTLLRPSICVPAKLKPSCRQLSAQVSYTVREETWISHQLLCCVVTLRQRPPSVDVDLGIAERSQPELLERIRSLKEALCVHVALGVVPAPTSRSQRSSKINNLLSEVDGTQSVKGTS